MSKPTTRVSALSAAEALRSNNTSSISLPLPITRQASLEPLEKSFTTPSNKKYVYDDKRCSGISTTSTDTTITNTDHDIESAPSVPRPEITRWQTFTIIFTLTFITITSCMSTGSVTISLPTITRDVSLAPNFALWPASIYSLTSGCSLLLAGTIADHIGNRTIHIFGCFMLGLFILASGLARTGMQLILFRGCQGVAMSMVYPTAFSIITETLGPGKRRNIAFASLGLGQPLGWSVGLVVGGLCEDTVLGWRFSFYLTAVLAMSVGVVNLWILPEDRRREKFVWKRFLESVDWIGIVISSTCLGLFCYVFATLADDFHAQLEVPLNIFFLVFAILLIPTFVCWMARQEVLGRVPLIPNSIWRNKAFTTICVIVILAWGSLQCIELFLSLYFQEIQKLAVIDAALRFLPNVVVGCLINIFTGLIVAYLRSDYLVLGANTFCAIAPLLFVLADPQWSFWACIFWGVSLSPLSCDIVFTVANLIITDVFPDDTQALAGAVFHTVSQFGSTIGVAVAAVISANVTSNSLSNLASSSSANKAVNELALLAGYRAVFWTCFAAGVAASIVGAIGLRGIGIIGKRGEGDDSEQR